MPQSTTSPSLVQLISQLHAFSPRLFDNQHQAADYLKSVLDDNHLSNTIETFNTIVPRVITARLTVDGQSIPCASTSLVSGSIHTGCPVVDSSKDYSDSDSPNLNYNGQSDCLSRTSHYFVPSLAFSRRHLPLVLNAKSIDGLVEIKATPHQSQNILVGNLTSPHNLVFTHFDSLEGGAMDNASGTAVTLAAIINRPKLVKDHLFIFSSDEELSLDSPNYWGKGYRDFEKKHLSLLNDCHRIYLVDGLGLTMPHLHQQEIDEYFPIVNITRLQSKIFALSCTESSMWSVYHSPDDTPNRLKPQYLQASLALLLKTLSS